MRAGGVNHFVTRALRHGRRPQSQWVRMMWLNPWARSWGVKAAVGALDDDEDAADGALCWHGDGMGVGGGGRDCCAQSYRGG